MQSHEAELEQIYGPLAPHSEHKRGDRITYHLADDEGEYSGVILWVCEKTEQVVSFILIHGVFLPDNLSISA